MSPQQILTTVMMCIVVDKSTDHVKPHFDLFFYRNINVKEMGFFVPEHELKKALRDTSTWAAAENSCNCGNKNII